MRRLMLMLMLLVLLLVRRKGQPRILSAGEAEACMSTIDRWP